MAKFISVTKNKAAQLIAKAGDMLPDNTLAMGTISDVRFTFTFTIDANCTVTPPKGASRNISAGTMQLNCFTSYKKHIAESYHNIGDYRPTAATVNPSLDLALQAKQDKNTITTLTLSEFVAAFDEYGEHLKTQMTGKDVASFDPSAIGVFNTSNGIAFTNNNDSFGKPFHCFPTDPTTASTKSLDLTGRQLMDFVALMSFRYDNGITPSATGTSAQARFTSTKKLYDQYKNEPWFQTLASLADRQEIAQILQDMPERIKTLKKQEGEAKRLESLKKKGGGDKGGIDLTIHV
jgi:hypothetical protein